MKSHNSGHVLLAAPLKTNCLQARQIRCGLEVVVSPLVDHTHHSSCLPFSIGLSGVFQKTLAKHAPTGPRMESVYYKLRVQLLPVLSRASCSVFYRALLCVPPPKMCQALQ